MPWTVSELQANSSYMKTDIFEQGCTIDPRIESEVESHSIKHF